MHQGNINKKSFLFHEKKYFFHEGALSSDYTKEYFKNGVVGKNERGKVVAFRVKAGETGSSGTSTITLLKLKVGDAPGSTNEVTVATATLIGGTDADNTWKDGVLTPANVWVEDGESFCITTTGTHTGKSNFDFEILIQPAV